VISGYITASLQHSNIREFIGIDEISNIDDLENLGIDEKQLLVKRWI
jgi:hypothetical protein